MKLVLDEIVEKFKQMKFETTQPYFYTEQILSLSFFQVIPHPGSLADSRLNICKRMQFAKDLLWQILPLRSAYHALCSVLHTKV